MKDHVIICGFGYTGRRVAKELSRRKISYVIIEKDREVVSEFYQATPHVLYKDAAITDGTTKKIIQEDAKSEETLLKASIGDAKAVLINVGSDAEAAFISLMAKELNPSVPIIVKTERLESMQRIYQAGATKVVSPSVIGGKMAARAALKPLVADFIDRITFMKGFEIAKVVVTKDSGYHHRQIKDLKFPEREASILAVHREGKLLHNPPPDTKLEDGDVLVLLGPSERLQELARL
ncbi:MAG: TrkA family potassium uptake protein [Euryarchaeota archaeon]|nr:TrkA family potassium uptake protein [Euryarchaeota archaeon]